MQSFRLQLLLGTEPLPFHGAMAEADKRRRLSRLVCISGVTDSALSRILSEISQQPGPLTATRQQCNKASLAEYSPEMALTIELPLKDGTFKWHLLKPGRLVSRCCEVSPALRRLFSTSAIVQKIPYESYCCQWSFCRCPSPPHSFSFRGIPLGVHGPKIGKTFVNEVCTHVNVIVKGEHTSSAVVAGIGTRRGHTRQHIKT